MVSRHSRYHCRQRAARAQPCCVCVGDGDRNAEAISPGIGIGRIRPTETRPVLPSGVTSAQRPPRSGDDDAHHLAECFAPIMLAHSEPEHGNVILGV